MRPDESGESKATQINVDSIHVGDIVNLSFGSIIPVDGIVLSANQLGTIEAAITGNSDERIKETVEKCIECKATVTKTDPHSLPSPVLLAGSTVAQGDGKMLTVMVGEKSTLGAIRGKKIDDQTIAHAKKPKMMRVVGKIVLAVLIVLGIIGRVVY